MQAQEVRCMLCHLVKPLGFPFHSSLACYFSLDLFYCSNLLSTFLLLPPLLFPHSFYSSLHAKLLHGLEYPRLSTYCLQSATPGLFLPILVVGLSRRTKQRGLTFACIYLHPQRKLSVPYFNQTTTSGPFLTSEIFSSQDCHWIDHFNSRIQDARSDAAWVRGPCTRTDNLLAH